MAQRVSRLADLRDLLPDALAGALRGAEFRYTAKDVPGLPPLPDAEQRVYFGPTNSAGQAYHWAHAMRRLTDVGAVNMQIVRKDFGFPSDNRVPYKVYAYSRRWQRNQYEWVTREFTHAVVESGRALFGGLYDRDPAREVRALREHGLAIAMLSHGTDLRLPSRHLQLDEWSPFRDMDADLVARLERNALEFRQLLTATDAPLFVSTPDLLLDWPEATWLPVVVAAETWAAPTEPLMRSRPVVVHAPTNAVLKGSDLIEPVMRKLHDEGVVEYRRISGVPAAEMPDVYKNADIVLEQFRIGTYSVSAVEAMAAGRIVVGHVHDQVRDHVRSAYGRDVPVVEATVSDLEQVLRDMVADPEAYRRGAATGPSFVKAVHDGSASAKLLREFVTQTSFR